MAGIGGAPVQLFEVTVLCGVRLKDTNSFTKQNPFVQLEYGSKVFRTNTSKGGGVNPSFQDKFQFEFIEGIKKLKVSAYNQRTLGKTIFIGAGKVKMQKVLDEFSRTGSLEETCWLKNDKVSAGEIRLLITCPNRLGRHQASSSSNRYYYPTPHATPGHQYYPHY